MEEERLADLFQEYDPCVSSSLDFMERLKRNLNAIEFIHQEKAAARKRTRVAVALAAAAGFMTGVFFTLIFPYIKSLVQSMMTEFRLPETLSSEYAITISWLLIGGISVIVALNAYTISLSLTPWRDGRREG